MKISDFESKIEKKLDYFKEQLSVLRVGLLNLDNIGSLKIPVYGSQMGLREVANLTSSGPGEIVVAPWDKSVLSDVEKGLRNINNAHFSVVADGDFLRLKASSLTQEKRNELVKEIGGLKEETKVAVRLIRQDQMQSLDEMEDSGEISEDDKFRQKDQIEKIVKKTNTQIEDLAQKKQEQIGCIN